MNPDLSIVVLHYNQWDVTKDCLASIDTQSIPCTYEKVLVDNGSTENRSPAVGNGWRVVRYEENRGHIVGQNRCFESATGKWVLFVANDVRLHAGTMKALLATRTKPRRGWWNDYAEYQMFHPYLFTPGGRKDNQGLQWYWPGYGLSHRLWLWHPTAFTGSCYLMPKQLWTDLGGFDEHLETSHEDIDFCLRAQTHNLWTYMVADATATHLGNATLKHQPSHNRTAFHRDRLYVLQKYYRGWDYWTRYFAIQLIDHLPRLE